MERGQGKTLYFSFVPHLSTFSLFHFVYFLKYDRKIKTLSLNMKGVPNGVSHEKKGNKRAASDIRLVLKVFLLKTLKTKGIFFELLVFK